MSRPVFPIYLDYASTGPVDFPVFEAMRPYFLEWCGNSAARQSEPGWRAEAAVELARKKIATAIGASLPQEIVFTSGATESNNLAVQGFFKADAAEASNLEPMGLRGINTGGSGNHSGAKKIWFVSQTEHRSVSAQAEPLSNSGVRVIEIPVDPWGRIEMKAFEALVKNAEIRETDSVLVSVMAVNNEVGNFQPLHEIGKICGQKGWAFHVDAAQALGKIAVRVDDWNASLVSLSGHKTGGPQGVGALYIRRRKQKNGVPARLSPLQFGGGHENGLRPGTQFVAGIVGLGEAIKSRSEKLESLQTHFQHLAVAFDESLRKYLPQVELNGPPLEGKVSLRTSAILNYRIIGVEAASLMTVAKKVAISSGAACAGVDPEPSKVLIAMGMSVEAARESVRISFGPETKIEEVIMAAQLLGEAATALRKASGFIPEEGKA